MLRRMFVLAGLLLGLLGLSGCVFGSVEGSYALPRSSEAYVNLQATINQEKGDSEYIAPLRGENRQTIQLVDLDGDGRQEAVAFFRDTKSEAPLKIVLFEMNDHQEYEVCARIEGVGTEIESISYLDLCGREGLDILVNWQVSAAVHTLAGYDLGDGEPVEILRTSCQKYLAADLDGDDRMELALAQVADGESPKWTIQYYDGQEGVMEQVSEAPLSQGVTDINTWTAGLLAEEVPGLFITSYFGRETHITDVLTVTEQGLENISLEGQKSPNVFRYYAGVAPADMNGDGAMDVPVTREIPAYGDSSSDRFWWMEWMTYGADGSAERVLTTYHGGYGGYLEIPEDWTGDFSMCRQENAAAGVRSVVFAKGKEVWEVPEDDPDGEPVLVSEPQPFLEICNLVGADRVSLAKEGGRFLLGYDSTTIYTGEFLPGWDCGLDQDGLKARYHSR